MMGGSWEMQLVDSISIIGALDFPHCNLQNGLLCRGEPQPCNTLNTLAAHENYEALAHNSRRLASLYSSTRYLHGGYKCWNHASGTSWQTDLILQVMCKGNKGIESVKRRNISARPEQRHGRCALHVLNWLWLHDRNSPRISTQRLEKGLIFNSPKPNQDTAQLMLFQFPVPEEFPSFLLQSRSVCVYSTLLWFLNPAAPLSPNLWPFYAPHMQIKPCSAIVSETWLPNNMHPPKKKKYIQVIFCFIGPFLN